jgi:hypothetical protein
MLACAPSPAGVDARGEALQNEEPACALAWGYVGEPAAPGTFTLALSEGGRAPHEQRLKAGAWLPVLPDRVQAESGDGRPIRCGGRQSYSCEDALGLGVVSVVIGAQRWTRDVDACVRGEEAALSFWLDDLAACVPPESVVLTGELHGTSGTDIRVALLGAPHSFVESARDPGDEIPLRPCEVHGSHYACRTLGYRHGVAHRLRVQIGARVVQERVFLAVDACQVQPVRMDVELGAPH